MLTREAPGAVLVSTEVVVLVPSGEGEGEGCGCKASLPPRNYLSFKGFKLPDGSVVKNPPAHVGDAEGKGSVPGLGRSSREGNGNQLQYSCLENLVDRGAWRPTVHGVAKSWTRLSD